VDSDELNSESLRVINLARKAQSPTAADMRRVRKALAVGLAATAAGAAVGTALASSWKGFGFLAGVRGIVAIALVASAGAGTAWWAYGDRGLSKQPASGAAVPSATAPVVAPKADSTAAAQDPLLAELTLLRRAQRALGNALPRQALELARRHATLYPQSQMALERDALQVFAYCAMARKSEARALATELLKRAPRSPLRKSLEESCAMR
jgi:hypothetical protein